MTQPTISVALQDGVTTITLDRPGKNNALDQVMADALAEATATAADDPSTRAILLRSEGRNFCVGGDVSTFGGADAPAEIERLARSLHDTVLRLATARAPVVAAVQGSAAGAGLSLAAAADLVVAGASASFVMAYVGIGLTPDGGATWTLPRLIGLRRSQVLAYTNRRLTASEAETWGLVSETCRDDHLQDRAATLARSLADGPTSTFGVLKRLLSSGGAAGLGPHLDDEATEIGRALARPDGIEGVTAFIERRPAIYPGA